MHAHHCHCSAQPIPFIIVDSLTFGVRDGENGFKGGINFDGPVGDALRALQLLARETGAAVIVLVHSKEKFWGVRGGKVMTKANAVP